MANGNRLGQFIRECRTSLGFTSRRVEELSRTRPGLSTISHSNLLAIEKGTHVPTFDKVLTLALLFNVPTQHFEERLRQDMLGETPVPSGTTSEDLIAQARTALAEGQYQRALDLFAATHAAALKETDTPAAERAQRIGEARLQVANCRARLGLLRVAKDELETLLAADGSAPGIVARASYKLAEICRDLRNYRLALLYARSALDAAADDPPLRARVLSTLANVLDDQGDTAAAIPHYREAYALFERIGDRRGMGTVVGNLGTAYFRLKDYDAALRSLDESLRVAREIGDRLGTAYGHANLARAHGLKGDVARSKDHARQGREIAQSEGYLDVLFVSLYYLWRAAIAEGEGSLSRVYAERLGALHRKLETRCVEADEWSQHVSDSRRTRS